MIKAKISYETEAERDKLIKVVKVVAEVATVKIIGKPKQTGKYYKAHLQIK